ncbi:hypothetical protein OFY17_07160 [Marinomonas sp. C2222]|uniref:AbiTii domain-containing protein n=1 Tax=Marinomonas sargassi TaxID=2984494 RepID=A0ABT2YRZ1_9GAMM|nr:hypothetical protein [Marinomonas sargassi]MCV2402658.1 hypothetical protein [Marinomonas sargassi]
MEVRKDLLEVEGLFYRLLAIGESFSKNIEYWEHLKNKEDFRYICRIPFNVRHLVEAVYADGRDMAQYMAWTIGDANENYADFPTLTSIIEKFDGGLVYGAYDSSVPEKAQETCTEFNENIWSVNQMIDLFRKQENSLLAVKVTLKILKETDLYKKENGIEIMTKTNSTINVSDVTGSAININSTGASVTSTYNEPKIFSKMLEAIKASELEKEEIDLLSDNVKMLATSYETGTFGDSYKDFMQNVSAHITVLSPFLAGIAALL